MKIRFVPLPFRSSQQKGVIIDMKRKLFALLTVFSLVFCTSLPVYALDQSEDSPSSFVLQQISFIASSDPSCPWDSNTTISSLTPLYSLDGSINGYVAYLSTDGAESGFAQIHASDDLFSIYCYAYEGHSEIDNMAEYWGLDLSEEQIYFLGSFKYLISTDEGFLDIASNSLLDVELSTLQSEEIAYTAQVQTAPIVFDEPISTSVATPLSLMPLGSDDDYTWPITSDFSNLSITYNGTTHNGITDHCSPTAATGIIRYLNHIGRTNCTTGESTATTFEKLYIALNTNDIRFTTIGGSGSGTAWAQIPVGLRWYASNNGCNLTIEQSNFNTLSSMKSNLDAGRLLQVEVEDFAGTSGGHSIAVTGYSSNSLYVQNGWNRNRIAYSYSSLDIVQYVYIG